MATSRNTATPRARAHLKAQMPSPGAVELHLLPPQLRLLVRAIGEEAAFKLALERGGSVLHVPTKLNEDHPLCDSLGPHAFGQLVREYGGAKIELTKADALIRQVRHQRVIEMHAAGCTLNEIAISTNYSRRHVINVLGDAHVDAPEQGDLFAEPSSPASGQAGATAADGAHNPFNLAGPGAAGTAKP